MYLFILESIGTSELLMIGMVALIVFGPRRLPQMMRSVGKAVAEFRRSTDDFKKTWEKEVNFEEGEYKTSENSDLLLGNLPRNENSIGKTFEPDNTKITAPEIREINRDDFSVNIPAVETPVADQSKTEISSMDKRNWL